MKTFLIVKNIYTILNNFMEALLKICLYCLYFTIQHSTPFVNYITYLLSRFWNEVEKIQKYYVIKFEKEEKDVFVDRKYIFKQNKSLTYVEVINLLNRRQKGTFYAPLLSFWPLFLTASLALFLIFVSFFFHSSKLYTYLNFLTIISLFAVGVAVSFWFSIFFIEKKKGNHGVEIRRNIQLGFYLFLFTEALCFIALFWVFLHSFLAASLHIGIYNPGEGIANIYINEFVKINENWNIYYFKSVGTPSYIRLSSLYSLADVNLYKTRDVKMHINFYDRGQLINPYKLPLLNTFILLTSAATLNASHVSLRTSKYLTSFFMLAFTILLGLFFVSVQYTEYKDCSFQYNDGIYAACFFSLTGLHGIHVMLGITALFICFLNLLFRNYSPSSHQSYMYSILYWHFVDVIWVLVYFIIYLWPASYFFIDELFTTYKNFFTVNFSKNYFNKVFKFNSYIDFKHNNQRAYFDFAGIFTRNNEENLITNYKFYHSSNWLLINKYINYKQLNLSFFFEKQLQAFILFENENLDFFSFSLTVTKNLGYSSFIDTHSFENYSSEFSINKNYYREILQTEYIKGYGPFNYNEIKKDPMMYCFILTEMHWELVNSVKCAYLIDLFSNYKKFMISKFFRMFGLEMLRYLWCFIFFPYMNVKDASIWYNI